MRKIKILNVLILAITLNFTHFVADATAKDENKQKVEEIKTTEKTELENKSEEKVEEKKEQETQGKNAGNNVKNKEKEEKAKIEEERRKEIEKNIEEHEKLTKKQIEKNEKTYKDFKKEDYEVEGFELKVYWKNGVPILQYTHEKTKAQIIIIPTSKKEIKLGYLTDVVFYKYFPKDNRGLANFARHCLFSKFCQEIEEKIGEEARCVASADATGLKLESPSNIVKKQAFFKELFESLNNPDFLNNRKIFAVEKQRIIDEQQSKAENKKGFLIDKRSSLFNYGGILKDLEKVSFNDLKNFYKEYVHPSNCVIVWHMDLNSKNVLNRLQDLDRFYLKNFDFKEINSKFKFRKNSNEEYNSFKVSADSSVLSAPINIDKGVEFKAFKNKATLYYYFDKLKINVDEKQSLQIILNLDGKQQKDLDLFVKKLGYDFCCVRSDLPGSENMPFCPFMLELYSNDEYLFKKEVLRDNVNKILEFIKNKISNMDEIELINVKPGLHFLGFPIKSVGRGNIVAFATSCSYEGFSLLADNVLASFAQYNNSISKEFFHINDKNEIVDSKNNLIEKTKKNLYVYDVLVQKGPSYVEVIKADEEVKIQKVKKEEYEEVKIQNAKKEDDENFIFPIKIENSNNNKLIYVLAAQYIGKKICEFFSYNKGYMYYVEPNSVARRFVGDFIGGVLVKKEVKENMLKFFKNDFKKFIEDLKYSKNCFDVDFKEFGKEFFGKFLEKNLKNSKEYLKNVRRLYKEIYNFNNGEYEENKIIKKDSLIKDFADFPFYLGMGTYIKTDYIFNNFKEYEKYEKKDFENRVKFFKKAYERKNRKVDVEFLREYKKYYLDYAYNILKMIIKDCEENEKIWKNVKHKDVVKAIKSAVYCEDETYKEINDEIKLKNKRGFKN